MANRILKGELREIWEETTPVTGTVTVSTGVPVTLRDPAVLSRMNAKVYVESSTGTPTVSRPVLAMNQQTGNVDVTFQVTGGLISYRLEVEAHHPQALDASYSGTGIVIGAAYGDVTAAGTPPEFDFWQQYDQSTKPGQYTYWIPLGHYYRANPDDVEVYLRNDAGGDWVRQVLGVDYN